MFTTRKVYSPYGISYTQKKKKTLKMFEKKNIKKNLEGAPSSLVVVGPDLFGAVCTVVVKISQSVKRKAYGCRNLPNFLFFLVLWLVDTFVPLKLCPPCRSFFFLLFPSCFTCITNWLVAHFVVYVLLQLWSYTLKRRGLFSLTSL